MIKLEFYLVDAFEIYHFLPIYKEIIKYNTFDTKFIAEPASISIAGRHFNYLESIQTLKALNLPYSEKSSRNTDVAITTQSIMHISHYKNKKIRLGYGVGLSKDNFLYSKDGIDGFDGLLLNGSYNTDIISKRIEKNRIKSIGYPKYDDFFKKNYQKTQGFNKNKYDQRKNLVYLPTWDHDSSVSLFFDELEKLDSEYNIFVKMHHCTARGISTNPKDKELLLSLKANILNEHTSLSDITNFADLVITDAKSGALTEIIYLDDTIPIIALSTRKNLKAEFYEDLFFIAPVLNEPSLLAPTVAALLKNDSLLNQRMKYSSIFYKNNKGGASSDAISSIMELMQLPRISKYRGRKVRKILRSLEIAIMRVKYLIKKVLC